MEDLKQSCLELGVAGKALKGYLESGDRHVYQSSPQGVLVAAIDGLGHGPQAAAAAAGACSVLESSPRKDVVGLVRRCHERLKGSRGVAMSLAFFDFADDSLSWLAVGNVQGILLSAHDIWNHREEALLLRPGVVGSHLPPLQAAILPLSFGDTMIFATDGIESNFRRSHIRNRSPQEAAERVLSQHSKPSDDALVVIARYKGPSL
jgi:phosphoserine phosphatase RsbX